MRVERSGMGVAPDYAVDQPVRPITGARILGRVQSHNGIG